jgi:hypothetical protein
MIIIKTQNQLRKIWEADDGATINCTDVPNVLESGIALIVKIQAYRVKFIDKTTGEDKKICCVVPSESIKNHMVAELKTNGYGYLKDCNVLAPKDINLAAYLIHHCYDNIVYCDKDYGDWLAKSKKNHSI